VIKVPDWITGALSRSDMILPSAKTVMLGGVSTVLEGAADDPYFQAIEGQAAAPDGLAALIRRQVPRNSTVIDVGANIGLSTILLARMTERVIAFEPSPPNVAFLRRNLERNGITNVDIRAVAASSEPGTLRFHVAQFGAGSHVVAAGHVSGGTVSTVDVPAVALDEVDLPTVAFIKIDAEGPRTRRAGRRTAIVGQGSATDLHRGEHLVPVGLCRPQPRRPGPHVVVGIRGRETGGGWPNISVAGQLWFPARHSGACPRDRRHCPSASASTSAQWF